MQDWSNTYTYRKMTEVWITFQTKSMENFTLNATQGAQATPKNFLLK
jgi:hypothetical protein